jgi:membrane protein YqaA with SNARE-associated domain
MIRRLYDWVIRLAQHRNAIPAMGVVSFMESSFFPIPPDVMLVPMVLANRDKAFKIALVCTVCSVLGGLFGYAIGYFLYEAVGAWLIGVLGLSESFPEAACYLNLYDWQAIVIAGATPVPFKLLTITAGFIEMALVPFVLASIAGRGMIFFTVGVLFRLLGAPIKRVIDKYLGTVTTLFVLLVVGGFIVLTQLGHGEEAADQCSGATLESFG